MHPTNAYLRLLLFLPLLFSVRGNFLFSQPVPEVLTPMPDIATLGIWQISEDRNGFIYLGSTNGLLRYDGNEFINLSKVMETPERKPPSSVPHLAVDPLRPRIWLGCTWGLWYYDWEANAFENIEHPSFYQWGGVSLLRFQNDSILWFGISKQGLFQFNTWTGEIVPFRLDQCPLPSCDLDLANVHSDFASDPLRPDVFWIATLEGLCRLDTETGERTIFYNQPASPPSLFTENNQFTSLSFSPNGQDILLLTYWLGLFRFNISSGSFHRVPGMSKFSEKVIRNPFLPIRALPDGSALIPGPWEDLIYDWESGQLKKTGERKRQHHRLSEDFTDSRGITWRGSMPQLLRYAPDKQRVENHCMMEAVYPMYRVERVLPGPEKDAFFVVADNSDGIKLLDRAAGTWKNLKPPVPLNPQKDGFRFWDGILTQAGQYLFVEEDGLYTLSGDQTGLAPHPLQSRLNGMKLHSIAEDQQGRVWIGTQKDGLLCLDLRSGAVRQYKDELSHPDNPNFHNYIHSLAVDKEGNIWIRCWRGFAVYLVQRDSFRLFTALPFQPNAFERDQQGNVWMLSDTCMARTDIEKGYTDLFSPHFNGQYLSFSDMRKYAFDRTGKIWRFGGEHSLYRVDPKDGSVVYFRNAVGLADRINSITLLPSGEIALGHFGCVGFFDPEKLGHTSEVAEPYITSLVINEKNLGLDANLMSLEKLDLPHDDNFLSFRLAAKGFHQEGPLKYRVKLEGLGGMGWIERDFQHPEISFYHLHPGKYRLRVQILDQAGVISPREFSLPIRIRPPWHLTWQAYLGYALLAAGLIGAAFRFQRQRLEMRMNLAAKEDEARRLQEIDEMKSEFFTNITHELRTPLQVILGQTEQLEEKLPETGHRHARIIRKESRRILLMVNQLLELASLKSGVVFFHYQQSDAAAFLRMLAESFHSAAEWQGVELHFHFSGQPLLMDFDPSRLQLIASNLLSNAIKFTPRGGRIDAGVREEDGWLCFTVSDTGIGIPEEEQGRIFDSFYQIESGSTRKWEGTGLGLAIVSQLAKAMGGGVSVQSLVGEGTAFTVRLPIRRNAARVEMISPVSQEEEVSIPGPAPEGNGAPAEEGLPLLLIVEDNEHVREYLAAAVSGRFQVVAAANGREGIALATALTPDIVVSDVMMPEADGVELLRHLKTTEQTNHIPVLMLTARAGLEDRLRGWEAGADEYLEKPVEKAELLARLDNLLQNRRLLQEKFQRNILPAPGPPAVENAFLKQALEIIEAEMGEEAFDINQLAGRLFLSRSQMHRKITALTGLSPSDLIRQLRLKKGKALLLATDLSISEVAYQCGFRTAVYFTQAFRKEFGMSPTEFKTKKDRG